MKTTRSSTIVPAAVLLAGIVGGGLSEADAAPTLDEAMTSLTREIDRYLRQRSIGRIAVDEFDGPSATDTPAKIRKSLAEKLKKRGYEIAGSGERVTKVCGRFSIGEKDGRTVVRVLARLHNRAGAELIEWSIRYEKKPDTDGQRPMTPSAVPAGKSAAGGHFSAGRGARRITSGDVYLLHRN